MISFSLLILNDPVIVMYNRLYTNVPCGNRAEEMLVSPTAPLVTDPIGRETLTSLAKVKVITPYAQASGVS